MDRVKIFVIYYKDGCPIINSEVYQPIMAGNMDKPLKEGFIGDDTGDNISLLNRSYGELTVHYWILKNYLPTATEDYIGVCHYRRFLDFAYDDYTKEFVRDGIFVPFNYTYFKRFIFERWDENTIINAIKDYDIATSREADLVNRNTRIQFDDGHRTEEMDKALEALKKLFPDYYPHAQEFFEDTKIRWALQFVMKKDLLKDYLEWQFKIIDEFSKDNKWDEYTRYWDVRMPAFIIERFFCVWLKYQIEERGIKILELPSYRLDFNRLNPDDRVRYIKKLVKYNKTIEPEDIDPLALKHPMLNRIIRMLVHKDKKYYKLIGNPKGFFFDSRSMMIRFLGIFYK